MEPQGLPPPLVLQRCLHACARASGAVEYNAALDALLQALQQQPAAQWAEAAAGLSRAGAGAAARAVLEAAIARWPQAGEPVLTLAQLLADRGDAAAAAALLGRLEPGVLAPPLDLAALRLLCQHARLDAAARLARAHLRADATVETTLEAIRLLRQGQRERDALAIAEAALHSKPTEARLRAIAGSLCMALGQFSPAREHFQAALREGIDLNTWFVGQALAHCQRYTDADHPDRRLLEGLRRRTDLTAAAQAALAFGLAKLAEDVGELGAAAREYRHANGLLSAARPWNRDAWHADLDPRLARSAPNDAIDSGGLAAVFVVGMPRTGTTLVAQRLARHPGVRVRGEPPFLEYVARQLDALGPRAGSRTLQQAAAFYAMQMRQDDAPADWYVDKNPLNLRWLDAAARLFPQARVIVCRRAPRDCALSIWTQFFAEDTYAFASDFAAIREVHDGAEALLRHWRDVLPLPWLEVDYARLVDDTAGVDAELASFLGLPPLASGDDAATATAITSASLWQARQPVYRHALGRGERFAALLPELRAAFPGPEVSPPRPPNG